jgi:ribosomal-protein-alanine N-acetyltransferase
VRHSSDGIRTHRLELMPATPKTLGAALAGRDQLGCTLAAHVPVSWPPKFLDDHAFAYTREQLGTDDAQAGWWMYFFLLRELGARALIGCGGYKGPPAADGTVEIGYSVVAEHEGCGYASEAAQWLIANAFACSRVTRVIGETLPELTGSIAVMRRCSMLPVGSSARGVLRFELTRARYGEAVLCRMAHETSV